MDASFNKTDLGIVIPVTYAEPVPTWERAKRLWTWAWALHTYGFGSVFLSVAIVMLISVVKLHSKCRNHKYVVTLNSMLLVCGMCRGFYLLIDPYWSTKILSKTFAMILFGVGHPCLTSAFSLLQWAFLRITQVKLGPWRFPSYRALSVFILFHFTLVISVDVAVSLNTSLKHLLIVTESMFILWGFTLCGIFIFKGFKITQFTSETQKALKQLSMYNHFKSDPEAFRKNGILKRVKRPKIRITNDEDDTLSLFSESSSVCSNSSIISCHVTRFNVDRDSSADEKQNNILAEPEEMNLLNNCKLEVIMNEDNLTVIDHTVPVAQDNALSSLDTTRPDSDESHVPCPSRHDGDDLNIVVHATSGSISDVCSSIESGSGSVYTADERFTKATPLKTLVNQSESIPSGNNAKYAVGNSPSHLPHNQAKFSLSSESSNGFVTKGKLNNCFLMSESIESHKRLTPFVGDISLVAESDEKGTDNANVCLDNTTDCCGYMADTEWGSPMRLRSKESENGHESDGSNTSYGVRTKLGFKNSEAVCTTISFYRIRQGSMLHKLVKVCYLTTMFQFILCILQLYAMFGVYGVLAKTTKVDPWPWYSFHTCFRAAELGMCSSMVYVTCCLGRYRHKASERKRRKVDQNKTHINNFRH